MTTIDPGSTNTTRWYTSSTLALPNSDWCIGMWIRPNNAGSAIRLWDTGGAGTANAAYLRMTNGASGTGTEQDVILRFVTYDGTGTPVIDQEKDLNYVGGFPADQDYLVIVQRRSGNLEMHVCEKAGTTFSITPVTWTQAGLAPGTTFTLGAGSGGANPMVNPYGEFFYLSGSSLSTANINTLKAGASITSVASPTRYYKLRTSNATETDLGSAGANLTQQGTGWTTASDFFADAGSGTPTITDFGDESHRVGETGVAITGTNFGATQATGLVKVCPSNSSSDANGQTLTVTAWNDTSITVDIPSSLSSLIPRNTNVYLFVKNDGGNYNASGYVFQVTPPPGVLAFNTLMN